MKLITRDTDYAIRALTCIAGAKGASSSVSRLAKELDMPRPFLRKILQRLNKEGLVKSTKGKGGGFSIVVSPAKISVFDLVEIFQGPFQLNEHVLKGKSCPRVRTCYLKKRLDMLEKDVMRELRSITIASLVKEEG